MLDPRIGSSLSRGLALGHRQLSREKMLRRKSWCNDRAIVRLEFNGFVPQLEEEATVIVDLVEGTEVGQRNQLIRRMRRVLGRK